MREDKIGRTTQAGATSPRGDRSSFDSDVAYPQEQPDTARDEDDQDGAPLSPDMQHFIGRQLRAVYDDVAKQPVPDRFLELMKQLDNKTGAR